MRAPLCALLLCGCLPATYVCYDDAECVSDGQKGVCTPERACAFPVADDVCATQLAYGKYSPAALAGQCYEPGFCEIARPDGTSGTFCDGLSVFQCQDFEDDTAFATWVPSSTSGSSVMLDTTRACRGKSSVKLALATASTAASTLLRLDVPADHPFPDPLYGRAFYYFASPLPVTFNDVGIATMQEPTSADGTQLVLDEGKLAVNNYPGGMPGNIVESDLVVPADNWVCLEWKIGLAAGTVDVWFDGNPVAKLSLDSDLTFPAILDSAVLSYGVPATVGMSQSYDAWVDEVILDGSRIGCTK